MPTGNIPKAQVRKDEIIAPNSVRYRGVPLYCLQPCSLHGSILLVDALHSICVPFSAAVAVLLSVDVKAVAPVFGQAVKTLLELQNWEEVELLHAKV